MNEQVESYAEIPAPVVRRLCNAFLREREATISRARDEIIAADMRKPWPFRPRTKADAVRRREQRGGFDPWYLCELSGWYGLDRVQSLLALGIVAGEGKVRVCAQDARYLYRFM